MDQRRLDYLRGWVDAIEHLLDVPEKAEDSLQAALRKAKQIEEVKELV